MGALREHRIYAALGGDPPAEHEPLIERAGIQLLIAVDYRGRERGIIPHREVQIEAVFLPVLLDPLLVKPVHRVLGVAVEPEL